MRFMLHKEHQRIDGSHIISILLIIWVYLYGWNTIFQDIFNTPQELFYGILAIISLFALLIEKRINRKVMIFCAAYLAIALINMTVVSYGYYVAVEAFGGFAIILPGTLLVSCSRFQLSDFLSSWYRFSISQTLLAVIAVFLLKAGLMDYEAFTYICLPNAIAISCCILFQDLTKTGRFFALFLGGVNFAIVLVFGGRMAAVATAFTFFISYMILSEIKMWRKVVIIVFGLALCWILISHIYDILSIADLLLTRFNLKSRSLKLLIDQIEVNGGTFYLTRRNIIYDEVLDYIRDRTGLPGGFGVALYLSNGTFYHPHNLFLQLMVLVGVPGMILFFIYILFKMHYMYTLCDKRAYQFTLLLFLDYFLISMLGASLLTSYIAIMAMSIIMFKGTSFSYA